MLQLKMFQKKQKTIKKDKFVTNERKISLSCYSFILFMKLRLIVFVSHIILSENLLNETKKNDTEQKFRTCFELCM